jgi:hypothetical protein
MQAGDGAHNYVKVYFSSPTWCAVCTQFIWGVTSKQGYKCTLCQGTAHGKCVVAAKPCPGKKVKGKDKPPKEGKAAKSSGGSSGKEKSGKDKGKKGAKGAVSKFKKIERKEFKVTDVGSFDDFFGKCQEPVDTICGLGEKVALSYDQLSELFKADEVVAAGIPDGDMSALVTYYVKEIKKVDGGDFKIEIDDGKPELEIKGKHAGRVEDFVNAIQEMVTNIIEFVETCPELVEQLVGFGEECASFPGKIQEEAAGLSPLKIPGALKKTTENIKYLGGVPGEFKTVLEHVKDFLKLLKDCASATI